MFTVDDVSLRLISYGPRFSTADLSVEPDILIAIEGMGTFKSVGLEESLRKIREKDLDLVETASKMHRESTKRGHASISTSLTIHFEINRCSRVSTMLLAASPFGSFLQESQRRRIVQKDEFFSPKKIMESSEALEKYSKTIDLSWNTYKMFIDRGVPAEDSRYVLPISSKTSIFVTGSLESFMYLIYSSKCRSEVFYPYELIRLGEMIEGLARKIAPILLDARLSFRSKYPSYPYPDPYKERDIIMQEMLSKYGFISEPLLLNMNVVGEIDKIVENVFNDPVYSQSLNPIISATFLEPLSLSAYHQSIRHRTVPTIVESIYTAVERAVKNLEKNIVIPPSIKSREDLSREFLDTAGDMVDLYSKLLDEGYNPSEAVYICPQALKIYVVRTYNAFNLLWPQGYVATRTCSYAQWEERAIAYSIWRAVEKASPKIGSMMGEKCKHLGYCPERNWCPIIRKYSPGYNDEKHYEMNK
ncbi:MAG: FAD-dependent thymidylate synthase [Nitrososphaerota archaeon]